jgi:hypothetical protein
MSRVKSVVRFVRQLKLPPDLHLRVVTAVQAADGKLLQDDWCNPDGQGCLVVVAAAALQGASPSEFARFFSGTPEEVEDSLVSLAMYLGTNLDALYAVIQTWDELEPNQIGAVLRKLHYLREKLERQVIFSRSPVRDDQLAEMRAFLADKSAESAPAKKEVIQVSAC